MRMFIQLECIERTLFHYEGYVFFGLNFKTFFVSNTFITKELHTWQVFSWQSNVTAEWFNSRIEKSMLGMLELFYSEAGEMKWNSIDLKQICLIAQTVLMFQNGLSLYSKITSSTRMNWMDWAKQLFKEIQNYYHSQHECFYSYHCWVNIQINPFTDPNVEDFVSNASTRSFFVCFHP